MLIPDITSPEHAELRATIRRLLERRSPESAVRTAIDSTAGFDHELWSQMATEMGLLGLGLPEAYGGSGFGPAETTIVYEELGRALTPTPFFNSIALAAELLLAIGDRDANEQYLPAIASGELIATVAVAERHGSWQPRDLHEVTAEQSNGQWFVSGDKTTVLFADAANLILVVITDEKGTSVYAVDPLGPGVTVNALSALDLTRRQSVVHFERAAATLVGEHGASTTAVAAMLEHASLALAAEQTGAAGYLTELSVDYAKIRHQFGRAIGSFQAIKHKLAEMAFDVERMESVVRQATAAATVESSDFAVTAAIAKVFCSEAFFRVAAETIQVHGGIGFTWEHPAHLYFRRAKSSEYLLGSPGSHREVLLAKLGV